jgi:hypothetical protein
MNHYTYDLVSLREQITNNPLLPNNEKENLLAILDGNRLVPLTSDVMAKKIFSPDLHPERFDFLVQRIINDSTIITDHSATNEPPMDSLESKRLIFDIASWLRDGRYTNLEFQVVAQEFIYKRIDIYSSRVLLMQYSAEKGHKDEVNYQNVENVITIVLMKESPVIFSKFDSPRYIHRIKHAVSDTGMQFPMLRQIAFVQLDKALEQFLSKTYNDDEDTELLTLLAVIADINNMSVKEATLGNSFFDDIYHEAEVFSQSEEVQSMSFLDDLNRMSYNSEIKLAADTREEQVNELYAWLFDNNRADDVNKASHDKIYLNKLFDEYSLIK